MITVFVVFSNSYGFADAWGYNLENTTSKQEVQSIGKQMKYPIILRKRGTVHQKLKPFSPLNLTKQRYKKPFHWILFQKICRSLWNNPNFATKNLESVDTNQIFGMGNYNKVLLPDGNRTTVSVSNGQEQCIQRESCHIPDKWNSQSYYQRESIRPCIFGMEKSVTFHRYLFIQTKIWERKICRRNVFRENFTTLQKKSRKFYHEALNQNNNKKPVWISSREHSEYGYIQKHPEVTKFQIIFKISERMRYSPMDSIV